MKQGGKEPPPAARDEARQLIQGEAERQRRMQAKLRADKRAKFEAEQAEKERLERDAEDAERARAQKEAEQAEQAEQAQLEKEAERAERHERQKKTDGAGRSKVRHEESRSKGKEHRERDHHESSRRPQRPPQLKEEPDGSRLKTPPEKPPNPHSPSKHGTKFGFLKKRKEDDSPKSPNNPANISKPRQVSNGNGPPVINTLLGGNGPPMSIKPGGGGVVPGIDAPISAVNAGDRRVLVERNKSSILLPITPTTTPLDLIRSASTCLSEPIDARASVLLESFVKVGVQRPLRHYEHVRDIMNSWDDDRQNTLVLVDSASGGVDDELSAAQVPETKPGGMSCYIYYSQRPGKWAKRFVTLRPDGQMVLAKSETAKDVVNVCHLSDFDIYSPTARKIAKSVKPPKKICFAIKSQQKSSMFENETSFVHFFSIGDKQTGTEFYKAVQGWRSWYLVNVMGEGQKKQKPEATSPPRAFPGTREVAGSKALGNSLSLHRRSISVDSHYQLGSFKPLLDLSQFEKPTNEDTIAQPSFADDTFAGLDTKTMHSRRMSTRIKGPPPVSWNPSHSTKESIGHSSNRLNSLTQSTSSQSGGEDTFAPTGLLGRNYSQRQRAQQEREQMAKKSGPFTDGPSLLNNMNTAYITHASIDSGGLGHKLSVRSTRGRESSDLHRGPSTRNKPKPLIDLTPQYREPPQHARKGKGFVPDNLANEPLIANATTPEEAIKIPPSTDWRARPPPSAANQPHGGYGAGGQERTRSLRGPMPTHNLAAHAVNNHTNVPEDETDAFTGRGLLANAGFSQGSVPVGHGVMDGSKAKGPMLDVGDRSRFVPGSLLASVEKVQGPAGPVIDREKRRSVELAVGEGL